MQHEAPNAPSAPDNGGGAGGGSGDGGGSDAPAGPGAGICDDLIAGGSTNQDIDRCLGGILPAGPADETPADDGPSLPSSFTVNDILEISPQAPTLNMEPDGLGIVGQPVNFWVDASTHQMSGTLLNRPVQVEFIPVGVRWDFGDGTTWETESLGGSWAELGLPELSDTATSHRYQEKATVTVTASVSYSATVHIAGRSIPVQGTVTAATAALTFELFVQSTVLVPNP